MKIDISEKTIQVILIALQKLPLEQSYAAFNEFNQAIRNPEKPNDHENEFTPR
jgi:hypothetical protein